MHTVRTCDKSLADFSLAGFNLRLEPSVMRNCGYSACTAAQQQQQLTFLMVFDFCHCQCVEVPRKRLLALRLKKHAGIMRRFTSIISILR